MSEEEEGGGDEKKDDGCTLSIIFAFSLFGRKNTALH